MATLEEAYAVAIDHHQAGRLDVAEVIYRRIIEADPDQADAEHLLGVIAAQQGRFNDAITLISAAVAKNAGSSTYFTNLGGALKSVGRYDEAIDRLARALALAPAAADPLTNIGASFSAAGHFDDAIKWLRRAVAIAPQRFEARLNLGIALRDRGRIAEAEAAFAAARNLKPGDPHLDYETAMLRLSLGDFAVGWRLFESRWAVFGHPPSELGKPQWRGEDIAGKSILLYFEQGLGDTLQFARYAPLLTARGARVTLLVQSSAARLIRSLPGVASVVAFGEPVPDTDLCCPLMSLPAAFGATLETIPFSDAYLSPSPALTAAWAERLGPRRRPRVGVAWAGNPRLHDPKSNALDRRRSLTFAQIAPLLKTPGVDFISLQMGEAAKQAAAAVAAGELVDPMGGVTDFADTAAIMAGLDLVISVDTSVVHVAAATGRPTWMLSRFDGCWRWLRDRDDSPWYPCLRLYRQTAPGDWRAPLQRLGDDLSAWSLKGAAGPGEQ
jgi:tetratricopeptide (TPR) repeat protein